MELPRAPMSSASSSRCWPRSWQWRPLWVCPYCRGPLLSLETAKAKAGNQGEIPGLKGAKRSSPLEQHLSIGPGSCSQDTQKALRVLDALRVSVLGLGLDNVKAWPCELP